MDGEAHLHSFGKKVGGLLALYEIRAEAVSRLGLLAWAGWQENIEMPATKMELFVLRRDDPVSPGKRLGY